MYLTLTESSGGGSHHAVKLIIKAVKTSRITARLINH